MTWQKKGSKQVNQAPEEMGWKLKAGQWTWKWGMSLYFYVCKAEWKEEEEMIQEPQWQQHPVTVVEAVFLNVHMVRLSELNSQLFGGSKFRDWDVKNVSPHERFLENCWVGVRLYSCGLQLKMVKRGGYSKFLPFWTQTVCTLWVLVLDCTPQEVSHLSSSGLAETFRLAVEIKSWNQIVLVFLKVRKKSLFDSIHKNVDQIKFNAYVKSGTS